MIRCDGETISPTKTYSGKRVLELLDIAFQNGYQRGIRDNENLYEGKEEASYHNGYKQGYNDAANELTQLRKLLLRILS